MKGLAALLSVSVLVLSGCGMGSVVGGASGSGGGVSGALVVQGTVHGGQQPVSGSTVTLWTPVYGTSPTPAPTQVATTMTDSSGNFVLPSYTCASSTELLYLTATGGSPGASSPVNNQILLIAALGPCNQVNPALLGSTITVNVNEVTTVASVYALAHFMNPANGNVGYFSTSLLGITNAFATVNNLVNISTGTARQYTPHGNGLVPLTEINTLANLLANCVNTTGGTAGQNNACGNLFTATTHSSNVPTNTLQAILNIALYPAGNPSGQWALVPTSGPFQPTLTAQPNDWTIPVLYSGTGPGTVDLAIDASGNIWTADAGSNPNVGGVSELSNLGVPFAGSPYLSGNYGVAYIAVDLGGNAWVANSLTAQIYEVTPGGASTYGPFSFQETSSPFGVAVDNSNNVWISNFSSSSVTEMSNQGAASAAISPSGGYTGGGLQGTGFIAIDAGGDAWVTNSSGNSLTKITPAGSLSNYPGSSLNGPSGIAVDQGGDLWVTSGNGNNVVEFNSSGSQILTDGPGPNVSSLGSVPAVDGANYVWTANAVGGSLSEFISSAVVSPSSGFQGPTVTIASTSYSGKSLNTAQGLQIDQSGNVWVADYNSIPIATQANSYLTEFIGLAPPAIQPLAVAAQQGLIALPPGFSFGTSLVVTTSSLPKGVQTAKYNFQLLAKGGSGYGYTWQVTSGASTLTSVGLTLSPGGTLSGTLSGTVSGAPIGVKVTDSGGNTATATLSLTVSALTTLSITTTNISAGTVGTNYNQAFAATGGSGSYTWSITSSTQQTALSNIGINFSNSGYLAGTPTATTTGIPFTVKVTDLATGQTASAPYTFLANNPVLQQCTHDGSGNGLLNGHYAFLLTGFDGSGNVLDQIGSFQANGTGTISNGMGDQNDSNYTSTQGEQSFTFTGTYSIGSTDNRGQLVINSSNDTSTQYFCIVADTVVSGVATSGRVIDASGDGSIQTGFFKIQNSSDFSNAGLTGSYAFGTQGVGLLSGTPPADTRRKTTAGVLTLNGSGGISGGQADNYTQSGSGGAATYTAALPVTNTGTYTVGSGGRGTLNINVTYQSSTYTLPYVIYEYGNGTGFVMLGSANVNSGVVGLEAGYAVQQTLTTFTAAAAAGAGVFRADLPTGDTGSGTGFVGNGLADNDSIGQFTFSSGGVVTYVSDQNSAGTLTTAANGNATGNFTVVSPGYLTLQNAGNQPPNFYMYAPGGGFGLDSSGGFWAMVPQTIPVGGFTSASLSGAYGVGTVDPLGYSNTGSPLGGGPYPNVFIATGTFGSGTVGLVQDTDYAPGLTANVTTDQVSTGPTWALDSTTYGSSTFGAAAGRFTINTGDSGVTVGYIVSPTQAFILTEKSGRNPQMFIADHQ